MTAHPLAPLLAWRQWIPVKLVPLANGKTDKLPIDHRTGTVTVKGSGGAHDPAIWLDHDGAARTAAALGTNHTIGFVITAADPFWCLDIDSALMPNGQWSPLALSLCAALPGTAVEVSQSGRGLHVWGQGPVPPHAKKNVVLGLEFYTELRFIAIGSGAVGDMSRPCAAIADVAARYFPAAKPAAAVDLPEEGPRADWIGPASDDELLRRALQSRSASATFGTGAAFADLFEGNAAVLARAYPPDSSSSEPFDRSSADAALFQHLAFWTGCDRARMLRIAERSALKRDKWEREDYVHRTVAKAVSQQRDVLADKPAPTSPLLSGTDAPAQGLGASPAAAQPGGAVPVGAALTATPQDAPAHSTATSAVMRTRTEATFLGPEQQASLFAGCIYIVDHHRVLAPGGRLLKPDNFKAVFGGRSFAMDTRNERTTRDAFEAFTQSQVLECPVADGTAFLPAQPFGTIVETEGRRRANMYWPANVNRQAGDAGPFLRHLAKLLPNPRDQEILMYYLAGCVQFAGHKFQWFPLLVGVEGNGKTFVSQCVAYAVGRRYTHWPSARKLGEKFNAWLFSKLLFCVEDLKIGDRTDVWETIKPMITGENLEIEGKGIDQRTDEVCGNFLANSNHRDAIRATQNDRRVCHLWTAQETVGDLIRDGMVGDYMSRLYDWARGANGYAIVADLLHTLVIPPEFGLNWLLGRAPRTSSTSAAQIAGMGRLEQEILEQVAQDAVGFRGQWISSTYLDRFLTATARGGEVLAPNKRRDMLRSLGYDWHPALTDGRTNAPVLPDGGKPRLYITHDHPARALTSPADVARAYSAAQGVATP